MVRQEWPGPRERLDRRDRLGLQERPDLRERRVRRDRREPLEQPVQRDLRVATAPEPVPQGYL